MTIIFKTGSIFDSNCEALVNPVNCVGVMGKGLALEFKEFFPENYEKYEQVCKFKKGFINVGDVLCVTDELDKIIINVATKHHWKHKSKLCEIEDGINSIIQVVKIQNIKSIAIPKLGCGCGGLDWNDVKPLIVEICGKSQDILFEIYE